MNSATPKRLASLPTGPELCTQLVALELGAMPDEQLLEVLSAQARQLSYQQAQLWATMSEIAVRDPFAGVQGRPRLTPHEVYDSAVDEIRAELRLTRRAARCELDNAAAVAAAPRVAAALAAGVLDRARALVLADGCIDLTDRQAAKLLDQLLPEARGVTSTGLAERVRRVAIALDPGWAERRYRQAVRERKVVGYLNPDGSATVSGQSLPAEQAAAACARVDSLADAAKRAGAAAPIDHLRAELFLGLLDGRFSGLPETAIVAELLTQFPGTDAAANCPTDSAVESTAESATESTVESLAESVDENATEFARHGVELKVGLGTLLGVDEQPGEIAGWGPVPASVARVIAARQRRGQWRFAIVDGDGQLLFDGITRSRARPNGSDEPTGRGGIVELRVPLSLLHDPDIVARHRQWKNVLTDLAAQYARRQPIEQDPAARFPGRPLRRRSQIKYQHCIFPGCRRPASACDQDHRTDHARGGPTDEANLAPGCRHDHMNKSRRGWRLIQRDPRTFVWISPLGRKHVVRSQPVAAPLPHAIPRNLGPEIRIHALDDAPPIFRPLSQHGRPLAARDVGTAIGRELDPDPPPY